MTQDNEGFCRRLIRALADPHGSGSETIIVRADARERLARHLYAEGSALEREAAARWDAGQVSRSRMDDYRRAADRALAVITGKG